MGLAISRSIIEAHGGRSVGDSERRTEARRFSSPCRLAARGCHDRSRPPLYSSWMMMRRMRRLAEEPHPVGRATGRGLRLGSGVSAQQASGRARLPGARRAAAGPKRARSAEADGRRRHGDSQSSSSPAMATSPCSVRAMKAGAVDFLTKPFRDQDLLDAIQQALERDRTLRAGAV